MVEKTLESQDDRIGEKRAAGKSDAEYRYELEAVAHKLVERMQADICKPTHVLRAVMHPVQAPQIPIAVKPAVKPISKKIGHQNDFQELEPRRLRRGAVHT